jgi:hypothetical protein
MKILPETIFRKLVPAFSDSRLWLEKPPGNVPKAAYDIKTYCMADLSSIQ